MRTTYQLIILSIILITCKSSPDLNKTERNSIDIEDTVVDSVENIKIDY